MKKEQLQAIERALVLGEECAKITKDNLSCMETNNPAIIYLQTINEAQEIVRNELQKIYEKEMSK